MLCALLQFGSSVSAVNRPSPPTARTRRSEPRTALSKRFSSLSSSTSSWPDTITKGAPIMSSQKIGPSSFASRARCCTGAVVSSDSMLPTTGFFGGCGIGLSLLTDGIGNLSPAALPRTPRHPEEPRLLRGVSKDEPLAPVAASFEARKSSHLRTTTSLYYSSKPLLTPFDDFCAHLVGLFLLRPMAAVADQV